MDILLTGSNGFIGRYVLERLISLGHKITCLVRSKNSFHHENVTYILFDIHHDNVSTLKELPKHLIHLAWQGLPNYKESFHLEKNLLAQKKFLDKLIIKGVNNITVAGTCMEYGMQEGCLSEDLESRPDTQYSIAKNELRKYLFNKQSVTLKWLRLFYLYGAGQSEKSIIPQLHQAHDSGLESFNMSGGEQVRDYLSVTEMARNIVSIALQDKVTGIINCCSGEGVKLKDFIETYKKQHNMDIPLNLGYYSYPDYEPMEFWGDIRKLNKIKENESKR